MKRFGYLFIASAVASVFFAFFNTQAFAVTLATLAIVTLSKCLLTIASPSANVQKLRVKISVPAGTSKAALPLILGDGDLAIFKLLLEHGKLNTRKQMIKYEGTPVYDKQKGTFNVRGRRCTPRLLKVVKIN
jgi:hypothetical protein